MQECGAVCFGQRERCGVSNNPKPPISCISPPSTLKHPFNTPPPLPPQKPCRSRALSGNAARDTGVSIPEG